MDMDGCGFDMFKGQEEGHVACGWREEGSGNNRTEEVRSQGGEGQAVGAVRQNIETYYYRRVFLWSLSGVNSSWLEQNQGKQLRATA